MKSQTTRVSRREFLQIAGLGFAALSFPPKFFSQKNDRTKYTLPEFPSSDIIGRNCSADTNPSGGKIQMFVRPDINSGVVRDVFRDEVFAWVKEVSAETLDYNLPNQRWVETPEGYLRSLYIQPCMNVPNMPLSAITAESEGFWAEVTVPYVDLENYYPGPATRKGWLFDLESFSLQPRFYYQQVIWVDGIEVDGSDISYRVRDRYGDPGDLFWADGRAFRPITADELSPIHPEVDPVTKKIIVNLNYQTLSCFEADREVFYCRVSTGAGEGSTPYGEQAIWRKMISTRMAANSVSTYELPAIPWTVLFNGNGVAIHGTTSHNDFGRPRSHGCVNCRPEDAKWIFRWTQPEVILNPGLIEWGDWRTGSTHVFVVDNL